MKYSKFFIVILFALLTSLSQAIATEESTGSFTLGKQYFDQGKFNEAYTELHKAFLQDPGNPDLNFYLGRAAFETGKPEEAVMAYERVLMADPDAQRVKLELARAHLQLGSREVAKQYFKEVQATNPPEQVWKNIDAFLANIEASEQKHFFNGTFTYGHAWDDNARSAPVSDLVFGLFQLIGPTATPQHDQANNTTLVLNHVYKNEEYPFLWKTSATSYNSLYQRLHDLDINYLGLATGPVFQKENYIWDIQAIGTYIDVEHDRYQSSFGAASSLTSFFSKNLLGTCSIKAEKKTNYTDAGRDALNLILSAGPILVVGDNRLSLLFSKEKENADEDINSYNRFGWKLRYDRPLPYDFSLFAGLGYAMTDYDDIYPMIGANRSDDVQELTAGISRLLWQDAEKRQALIMQLGHTYTYSESNVDLYTYRKNVTELNLTVSF